jgi:hypothetical protein
MGFTHKFELFFLCANQKSENFIKTTIQVSLHFNEFVCLKHQKMGFTHKFELFLSSLVLGFVE